MVALAHVLAAAWERLPDEVRDCPLVTRGGLPTGTMREGFLLAVLQDAEVAISQRELTARAASTIDDDLAQRLTVGIRSSRDRIVGYTRWVGGIDSLRDRRIVRAETVHRIARRLEAEHGAGRDAAVRQRLIVEALSALSAAGLLDGDAFQRLWRDADACDAVQAEMDAAWSARPASRSDATRARDAQELYLSFLEAAPSGGEELDAVWERIRTVEDGFDDDVAKGFGLTRAAELREPDLYRAAEESIEDRRVAALDATIALRIARVLKGVGTRAGLTGTAQEVATRAAVASAAPLGLADDWARKLMAIGDAAAMLLTWDPRGSYGDRRFLAELRGGQRQIAVTWRVAVARARTHGHLTHTDDAVDFFQSPRLYFAGRLWTRVLRRSLVSGIAPSAREAWDLVYGAVVSARAEIGNPAAYTETVSVESHEPTGRRPPPKATFVGRSAVDDVLQAAIDAHGWRPVAEFWNDVARLPPPWTIRRRPRDTETPPDAVEPEEMGRLSGLWSDFVAAEMGADDDVSKAELSSFPPFEVAWAWIAVRGPLRRSGEEESAADVSDGGIGEHERVHHGPYPAEDEWGRSA